MKLLYYSPWFRIFRDCSRLIPKIISGSKPLLKFPIVIWILFWCATFTPPGTVEASSPGQRIISMAPSITEILFELGLGDRVVGVTDFCTYPEAACKKTSIGGMVNPNVETWLSLKPDLIIDLGKSGRILQNAHSLGIPTFSAELGTLEDIFKTILKFGDSLDCKEAAGELVRKLKNSIGYHQDRLKDIPKKSVLIILGDSNDPTRDLYSVGRNTFLGEILDLAGGENILPVTMARYPKISKEFIIEKSPEVIIEAGPKLRLSDQDLEKKKLDWKRFATISAVQKSNIHFIGADYILIPGPRLIKILSRFARAIHPEVFTDTESDPIAGAILP